MTDTLVHSRRDELYGQNRNVLAQKLIKTLKQDHVLQKGEYNYDKDREQGVWKSTTKKEYTHKLQPEKDGKLYGDPNLQMHSHFSLGNDSGRELPGHTYMDSVTKFDYAKKTLSKPEVRTGDHTVNWPDMAPQYSKDRSTGKSEYDDTFKMEQMLDPKKPVFPRLQTSIMTLPIDMSKSEKLRGVHLDLGTDIKRDFESESKYAYETSKTSHDNKMSSNDSTRNIPKLMKDMERSSHVFRGGDYDGIRQSMASTFNVDYSKKSEIPLTSKFPWLNKTKQDTNNNNAETNEATDETRIPQLIDDAHHTKLTTSDAAEGKAYHTKRHFDFGTDPAKKLESIYIKDYEAGTMQGRPRPAMARNFPDSQVLQSDRQFDSNMKTTHSADFSEYNRKMATKSGEERMEQMRDNMTRRFKDSIHLSYDNTWHRTDRQRSLSHDDYIGPPSKYSYLGSAKGPTSKYNFLETDGVLKVKPKKFTTEQQDNYKPSFMDADASKQRRKYKDDQCKTRLEDGRSAHFILGDADKDHNTETDLEYSGRPKQDGEVAPAGKMEDIPKFKFVHFKMSDNQQDLEHDPQNISMMEGLSARNTYVTRSQPAPPVHHASVMAADYQPFNARAFTDAQVKMLEQDKKLSGKSIADSHFFHYDNKNGKNFTSTTTSDFIAPEIMSGRVYLEAK